MFENGRHLNLNSPFKQNILGFLVEMEAEVTNVVISFQGVAPTGAQAGIQGKKEQNKPCCYSSSPSGTDQGTNILIVLNDKPQQTETLKVYCVTQC